jgi:hypothetical protein
MTSHPIRPDAVKLEDPSAQFRAHLERSVFRDLYSTPEQRLAADALSDDARRYFESLISYACDFQSSTQPGVEPYAHRDRLLQQTAPWLEQGDRERLLSAAAYMMR